MCWETLSNISSLLSIAGAISSGFSLRKIKGYYKKISSNNNFEKLTSTNSDIIEIRKLYENIRKCHAIQNNRGINLNKTINEHLQIESYLDNIRMIIPSKYKDILNSISSAKKQIAIICEKELYYENNDYFKELGIYLTNIEDGIKLAKEDIRGF